VSSLKVENIQIRQGHRAIVDLVGKSIHILSVPMPNWVKEAVESLHDRSQGRRRSNLRTVSRHGTPWRKGNLRECHMVRGPEMC
jgi:hypothetical protein